jgi:hypothetical protein
MASHAGLFVILKANCGSAGLRKQRLAAALHLISH